MRALGLLLDPAIDLRDASSIGYGILAKRETRPAAIAFIEAHIDEILKRMRDDEATWLLDEIAANACDQTTISRLEAVVLPRAKKIGGAEAMVTRSFELSRQCIASTQRMLPALTAYLK